MSKPKFIAEMLYRKNSLYVGSGVVHRSHSMSHAEAVDKCKRAVSDGYRGHGQVFPTLAKVRTVEHGN